LGLSDRPQTNFLPVSVIVLTKNSERTIEQCLEAISRNEPHETIIIDGGSTDKTIQIAENYTDRIYYDAGKGLSYARQLGAELATQPFIMYVDSDVVVKPDTLRTMLSEVVQGDYAGIHARLVGADNSSYWAWAAGKYKQLRHETPGVQDVIGTAASMFRREILLRYGFDSTVPNCDDRDLSFRLTRNGYKLGLSTAVAYHYYYWGFADFFARTYRRGVALAEFFFKYNELVQTSKTLGFPIFGTFVGIREGQITLLPYFLFYGIVQFIGFLMGCAVSLTRKTTMSSERREGAAGQH